MRSLALLLRRLPYADRSSYVSGFGHLYPCSRRPIRVSAPHRLLSPARFSHSSASPSPIKTTMGSESNQSIKFSNFDVTSQTFYLSADRSVAAIVNLKPIVPGHVLVIPVTPYHRLSELPTELVSTLFRSVQEVSKNLETTFEADAMTIAIQDGEAAGQTVPHLHVHILPRKKGDITPKDRVYDLLQDWGFDLKKLLDGSTKKIDASDDRKPRSREEMENEATFLASLFKKG